MKKQLQLSPFQASKICLLIIFFISSLYASAQRPGSLDMSFNPRDTIDNTRGARGSIHASMLQPDGKLVIAGQFDQYNGVPKGGIVRIHPDGSIDESFNVGKGLNTSNYLFYIYDLALQPDGKILLSGSFNKYNDIECNGLIRINTNGSLDTSFNTGIGSLPNKIWGSGILDIELQTDGKILIGGRMDTYNNIMVNNLARINTDGSIDTSFNHNLDSTYSISAIGVQGDGNIIITANIRLSSNTGKMSVLKLSSRGVVDTSFTNTLNWVYEEAKIKFQPDGKILVSSGYELYRLNDNGSTDSTFQILYSDYTSIYDFEVQTDNKIVVVGAFTDGDDLGYIIRLNADGEKDSTFYESMTQYDYGWDQQIRNVNILPDGKLIISGIFNDHDGIICNSIMKLTSDGRPDLSFNKSMGLDNPIYAAHLQADGKILITGSFTKNDGRISTRISRIHQDGSIDSTFNTDFRIKATTFYADAYKGTVKTFAVQQNGRIIMGGDYNNFTGRWAYEGMNRLLSNGDADSTWYEGSVGYYLGNADTREVLVQPDDKVLVAGPIGDGTDSRGGVIRLDTNGRIDSTYTYLEVVFSPNTITLQPDNKILVGGRITFIDKNEVNPYLPTNLGRLNTNGTYDSSFVTGTGIDGTVYAITLQPDNKIIVAGQFTNYNDVPQNNITRLNPDGSRDTTFNIGSGADGEIYAVAIQQDGNILIGGNFTSFNGLPANSLARLNNDGSLDMSFNAGTGPEEELFILDPRYSNKDFVLIKTILVLPDGNILIGGNFTKYNGTVRNHIAKVWGGELNGLVTAATKTTLCQGATVSVPFQSSYSFNQGNIFTSQLSDAHGSFANPIAIGSLTSTATTGTINTTIPLSASTGTGYRIRVVASDSATVGYDNGHDISITAAPVASFTYQLNGCCQVSISNTSIGSTTYRYNFGDGSPVDTTENPTHTYATSGTYTITQQVLNASCMDTSTINLSVTVTSAQANINNKIKLFPNPTAGEFTIDMSGITEPARIEVYNLTGQQVFTKAIVGGTASKLNLGNLPGGSYFVRINMSKEVVVKQLMLQK